MSDREYIVVIRDWLAGKPIEKKYRVESSLANNMTPRKAMQMVACELYGSQTCLISVIEKEDDGLSCQLWKPDNSTVCADLMVKNL